MTISLHEGWYSMGHRRLKTLIIVLLCVTSCFLAGLSGSGNFVNTEAAAEQEAIAGTLLSGSSNQVVVTGERYELTCNPKNGNFWVNKIGSECVYQSNPDNPREDSLAKGTTRTNMQSQLLITVADKKNNLQVFNSAVDSVANDGLRIYADASGMTMQFVFADLGITIPLQISLSGETLQVSIDPKQVKEESDEYKLVDISVLPYFIAGGPEKDGWYLLPDGSGSLMRFHNGKGSAGVYKKRIYDSYRSSTGQFKENNRQPVTLPLYGVHIENEGGALAVVEEGAAFATLNATPAGYKCSYANAYISFQYRESKRTTLLSRTASEVDYWLVAKNPSTSSNYVISYTFLDPTENDYVAMARLVQQRLFGTGSSAVNNSAVFLDVYNSVKKTGYTLGIPHQKSFCITTFEQTQQIVEDFASSDVVLQLHGWNQDGALGGEISSRYSPAKVSGGKKALASLLSTVQQENSAVYLAAELVTYSRSRVPFAGFFRSAKDITQKRRQLISYLRSTNEQRYDLQNTYFLKPSLFLDSAQSLIKRLPDEVKGLAVTSLTVTPYADYGQDKLDSNQTQELMTETLQALSERTALYAENPDFFAMPYLSEIADIPVSDSGYDNCDESVPFLQLVLRGYCRVSGPAINLTGDPDSVFLKAIETGTSLKFAFVGEYEAIRETELNYLYGAVYNYNKEKAQAYVAAWEQAMEGLTSAVITDHRYLAPEVTETVYDTGDRIIVNFGAEAYEGEGVSLSGKTYIRVSGEGGENR